MTLLALLVGAAAIFALNAGLAWIWAKRPTAPKPTPLRPRARDMEKDTEWE